jgi:hypothetical protein
MLMRKLYWYLVLAILFVFFPLNAHCQSQGSSTSGYKQFTRFDVGYERIQYRHAPASNAAAIEFEKSFGRSRFSRNYRLSIGETESNQFYTHIPGGVAVSAILFVVQVFGNIPIDKEPYELLFRVPDGFGFTPVQRDKLAVGVYANLLSVDYTNRFEYSWDYAPDAGIRSNFYFNDRMFAFTRVSAKYSFGLAEWAAQGTFGVGWDFGTK